MRAVVRLEVGADREGRTATMVVLVVGVGAGVKCVEKDGERIERRGGIRGLGGEKLAWSYAVESLPHGNQADLCGVSKFPRPSLRRFCIMRLEK